jgi:hypothetical protein
MEPGSLVMERKMLYGIKQRAEELASQQRESARAWGKEAFHDRRGAPRW